MPARARVLLCEDNPDLAENLRELIGLLEFDVQVAPTIDAAFESLNASEPGDDGFPAVVVTDLRVEDENGLDLVRHAKTRAPELPVVLVSGFLDDGTRALARAAGVNEMFDKPVDHDALLEALRGLVARRAKGSTPMRPLRQGTRHTPRQAQLDPPPAKAVRSRNYTRPLEGVDVLIVDDNEDLAENIGEFLVELGAQVRYAQSCEEARAAAPPELALVDIHLPDGSGSSLIAELRERRQPRGEVLLITGHASLDGAILALRRGAFAYLLKPIDLDELEANVRRAAEAVRMRQREYELTLRLQENEAKLRTLVDHTRVLLIALDADYHVRQANAAVEALTGASEAELLGAPWVERFVREESRDHTKEHLADVIAQPHDAPFVETVEAANGELRQVSWLSRALPTPAGTWIFRAGLDVTDQLADQARARRAEKLAAVGTLAAGLAHEIRNPLNGASLQLQVLERRLEKAAVQANWRGPVQVVREEITRLGRLVEEFMSFARPRALEARAVDLQGLLNKVLTLCARDAEARGVELSSNIDEGATAHGDADRLTQVFLNLTRNAIEASPTGERVELSARRLGNAVLVSVRDRGAGIPDEVRDRVFEPFFTTKEGGTGLGLAICHSIIEQHGGTLEIEVDAGTRVDLTLPSAPTL